MVNPSYEPTERDDSTEHNHAVVDITELSEEKDLGTSTKSNGTIDVKNADVLIEISDEHVKETVMQCPYQ